MTLPVGEWIKVKRKAKKLSLAKLAQKAGCSDSALFWIERGRKADFELLRRIVAGLDESFQFFLQETGVISEEEQRFLEDPEFAKIYFELQRKRELNPGEKRQLAEVLLQIIKRF
ncbi:helix-turn-helix transcriptional regulator [Candidatus Methylomirabilis sp.]|uniref:helix-turn-helix domain-containing protein n=1 Tax=Candidatus Methylomirabilis sp. TaxID=2032687 RepID=UPI002A6933EF|nr:helix-turn-helix transcriptional regulator [Candidatus Methylomirabilis sp.]